LFNLPFKDTVTLDAGRGQYLMMDDRKTSIVGDVAEERVPALTRAIKVLEIISEHGTPLSLSDLARELDAPKSSLLNICAALVSERLLLRTGEGTYGIGLRVAEFARAQLMAPRRLRTIGLVLQTSGNPFYAAEESAVTVAASRIGATVIVRSTGQTVRDQAAQLAEFQNLGVEAVLLDAIDSNGVAESVRMLRSRGVPTVAINVGAAFASGTVTTDNVLAGETLGRFLATYLGGRGAVGIIGGTNVTAVSDRITGFLSAIRDLDGLRVAGREDGPISESGGYATALRLLEKNSRLDALFAINDPTAIGAAAALRETGRDMPIVSVDGSSAAVRMILDQGAIIATAAQSPTDIATAGFELAEQLVRGVEATTTYRTLAPVLITAENAGSYRPWG
jgi:ribose transport system substrate-binding protein